MRLSLNEDGGGDQEGPRSFSGPHARPPEALRRRSRVRKVAGGIGWLFGGPRDWADVRSIRRGFSLIGGLARNGRQQPASRCLVSAEDRTLDLEATAFSHGSAWQRCWRASKSGGGKQRAWLMRCSALACFVWRSGCTRR